MEQKPAKPKIIAFKQDLAHILNCYGLDNWANTPDFILSDFLYGQLCGYHHARTRSAKHAQGGPFESMESFEERRKRVAANYASSDTKGPGRPPFTGEGKESVPNSLKSVFDTINRLVEVREKLRESVKHPVPSMEAGLQFTWQGFTNGICEIVSIDPGDTISIKYPVPNSAPMIMAGYKSKNVIEAFERGVFMPLKLNMPKAAFPFGGTAPVSSIYEAIAGNYRGEPGLCMCMACVLERGYEAAAAQGLTGKVETDAERRRSQQNAR